MDNLDKTTNSFLENLERHLGESAPEISQLLGEALYFHFLIVRTKDSTYEQQIVNRVLGWSKSPIENIRPELIAGLTPGILNPGQYFLTKHQYPVWFLIEFVEGWKEIGPDERTRLLNCPWRFKEFVTQLSFRSVLLAPLPGGTRTQRDALLHLTFPDTFEAMVSVEHKQKIAETFATFIKTPEEDVDRQLTQIRHALEAQFGTRDHFFYRVPEVRAKWKGDSPLGDTKNTITTGTVPTVTIDPWSPPKITSLAQELLWEPEQLQKIIDGLKYKRQMIFHGPPGTGKTYVANRIAEHCREHGGDFQFVQFHPSYSYEDFIEGFRPKLFDDRQPGFELTPGPLRRIAKQAQEKPDSTFIMVIDELNRGNVAKVFGELYFLLEYRNKKMRLQYGDEDFIMPPNLWFICTMNTADRSIALMDAALRRRFRFFPFFPDELPIEGLLRRWLKKRKPDMEWVADLVDIANNNLDRHSRIGPSYFMAAGDKLSNDFVSQIWEGEVIPYVEEQFFGNEEKLREFKFEVLKGQLDTTGQPVDETDDGLDPE